MNFKGFDDWVPVFMTGIHTDSEGRTREWTEEDLDKIVTNYNPDQDEAPAVIGHPKETAPAYGWVEGLKREGIHLMAKFKDVVPEFAEMVKRGLFKKRSISIRPDLTLKHVGFLGAVPPAIKGLPNMEFKAGDDAVTIEFGEVSPWTWNSIARIFRNLRDWLIEKEGKEAADRIIEDWAVEDIKAEGQKPGDEQTTPSLYTNPKTNKNMEVEEMTFKDKLRGMLTSIGIDVSKVPDDALPDAAPSSENTFSEADLAKAAEDARKAEREKVVAEYAEKDREARQEARQREISTWCEDMVKEGKLTPALVKFGVPEMLSAFAEKEGEMEFGEEKTKSTAFDRFKALFETELPKVVTFGEVATRDTSMDGGSAAGEKLVKLTREKMDADKNLSYSEAFDAVQRENPDLTKEYAAEVRG